MSLSKNPTPQTEGINEVNLIMMKQSFDSLDAIHEKLNRQVKKNLDAYIANAVNYTLENFIVTEERRKS